MKNEVMDRKDEIRTKLYCIFRDSYMTAKKFSQRVGMGQNTLNNFIQDLTKPNFVTLCIAIDFVEKWEKENASINWEKEFSKRVNTSNTTMEHSLKRTQ